MKIISTMKYSLLRLTYINLHIYLFVCNFFCVYFLSKIIRHSSPRIKLDRMKASCSIKWNFTKDIYKNKGKRGKLFRFTSRRVAPFDPLKDVHSGLHRVLFLWLGVLSPQSQILLKMNVKTRNYYNNSNQST